MLDLLVEGIPSPVRKATTAIDTKGGTAAFVFKTVADPFAGRISVFRVYGGTITADPESWNSGSAQIEIQSASIDTRQAKRDTHLRSEDFFDAVNYPTITFTSTSVEVKGNALTLKGDLTIRGVTRPVVLTGEYLGMTGAPGKERIGFTATTKINRLDYGVKYNRAVEGGGMLLARLDLDEVHAHLVQHDPPEPPGERRGLLRGLDPLERRRVPGQQGMPGLQIMRGPPHLSELPAHRPQPTRRARLRRSRGCPVAVAIATPTGHPPTRRRRPAVP